MHFYSCPIVAISIEIFFVVLTLLLEIIEVRVLSPDGSAGMTISFKRSRGYQGGNAYASWNKGHGGSGLAQKRQTSWRRSGRSTGRTMRWIYDVSHYSSLIMVLGA